MYFTVLAFYVLWFVLTCLHQGEISWLKNFTRKVDVFSLLPLWTFFAPNPGVSDYHLLYRIQYKNGLISPFNNVILHDKKSLIKAIWNPQKRSQKALNDFVQEIRNVISTVENIEANQSALKLSFSYIVILHYCTELSRHVPDVKSVQFIMLESFGYFEHTAPRLILNSEFHNV